LRAIQLARRVIDSPNPRQLKLLLVSDMHNPASWELKERILSRRSFLEDHDHAVFLGDQVCCYGTPGEYAKVNEFLREFPLPYAAICGNHEFHFRVVPDEDPEYGKIWERAAPSMRSRQRDVFRRFYGLGGFGAVEEVDWARLFFLSIGQADQAPCETLAPELERGFQKRVAEDTERPAIVFCHCPLPSKHGRALVYYNPQADPCMKLSSETLVELCRADRRVFWFSGHIHLHPANPLYDPYEVVPGVWNIHCPDSWGFSRWTLEEPAPRRHDDLFGRSVTLAPDEILVSTFDYRSETFTDHRRLPLR